MRGQHAAWFVVLALVAACGGTEKPAESPKSAEDDKADIEQPEAKAEPKTDEGKSDEGKADEGKGDEGKGAKPAAEPEFKEGMSVDEAINAVPQGTERVNVDQQTLGKPLMDEELYKPCKLAPTQHFKLRVAIWEGHAVGIDVTATPKNPKVEECVKAQIKAITWKASVKSLNTVEYAF